MSARTSLSASTSAEAALPAEVAGWPFPVALSLEPLIQFWTGARDAEDCSARGALAGIIGREIAKVPELRGTIADPAVLEPHRDVLDVLMAAAFPPALCEQEYGAALIPYVLQSFYATPAAGRLLIGPDGRLRGRVNLAPSLVASIRRAMAYAVVLDRVYGIRLELDYPIVLTVPDPDTGLDRHFKVLLDPRFIEVEVQGDPPPLPPGSRERLPAALMTPDVLADLLPSDRFRLRGFLLFRAIEITDQEVLSAIKRDLIDRESIVSSARFEGLQARLRTLLRRPLLHFGLAVLEGDRVLVLNCSTRMERECIFADSRHHDIREFEGSIYARAVQTGTPMIVGDLAAHPGRTAVDEHILASGVRTLLVAPLHYQDRVIGTLELSSPEAHDLDATHLPKLQEVLPLFSMAVQRSMEELNTRIQAVIKEKATAIHPVVEWKFRRAVLNSLERHPEAPAFEMDPIVFDRVYPLYGLADVRGSSTQRARAIQVDLLGQLALAREVVDAAHRGRALPVLHELLYRLDRHAGHIEVNLSSGDETGVLAFLQGEIEPLLDHLAGFGPAVRERAAAYRAALDPRLGTVYAERRRFEESLTALTDAVSGYLDLEEQAAQAMFPHYFEKQKTDGVDYQIFVGASLLEDGGFDPLYLKNLRLWQLMVACGIALRSHQLGPRLSVPLEIAQLVLAQSAPLAIRFRFDEKRFDVDGAYNMRYEIMKKRIDKAVVRATTERLTQPGRLAIVYGQPAEAAEYRGYVEYLQSLGYLAPGVEDLALDELQGVSGLRALRVTVDLGSPAIERAQAALALDRGV